MLELFISYIKGFQGFLFLSEYKNAYKWLKIFKDHKKIVTGIEKFVCDFIFESKSLIETRILMVMCKLCRNQSLINPYKEQTTNNSFIKSDFFILYGLR